jgi:hypothetical protein
MIKKFILVVFPLLFFLNGCATTEQAPKEAALSIELNGSAVEVQNFIEENSLQKFKEFAPRIKLVSANDRAISFESYCIDVKDMGAFKCTGILLVVGNTGWDGPYLNISFRTNEIRGVTTVRASHQWCAINLLGKQSCGLENISKANDLLRDLKNDFEKNS